MNDSPAPEEPAAPTAGHHPQSSLATLAVSAVGIVFGDIGTSPIYAFRETFSGHHELPNGQAEILGVLSLIFWSMMIVVTLKYVAVIMRADNKGEGGSLALLALINRKSDSGKRKWTKGIVLLGVFACALFYGDSMITPAISVLSAVEGLTTVQAGFEPYVVPIAITILAGLFAIQATGTARVGALFGPVMIVYFVTIAVLGIIHIVDDPMIILQTVNPLNAFRFFASDKLH
ncbi:MAG TPA: KUP/HAK/KT family potassium transporter, partial [Allosphingosinicella sp.]|nr:KUP/HAK/KT family potassium transporter [Allosphingosinicella sp.]